MLPVKQRIAVFGEGGQTTVLVYSLQNEVTLYSTLLVCLDFSLVLLHLFTNTHGLAACL